MLKPLVSKQLAPLDAAAELQSRSAFESLLEEMLAVDEKQLLRVNIDLGTASGTALGLRDVLRKLRPRVEALVPSSLPLYDKLQAYAWAALHASVYYAARVPLPPKVAELAAEIRAVRDRLASDVRALQKRGLISFDAPVKRGRPRHVDLAFGVGVLCAVLRNNWPAIEGRTAVQLSEIDAAEELSLRFARAVGERQQASPAASEVARMRRGALTLFVRAYDEVRRAVGYVRFHEGDADELAPNLYARDAAKRSEATKAKQRARSEQKREREELEKLAKKQQRELKRRLRKMSKKQRALASAAPPPAARIPEAAPPDGRS